MATSCTCGEVVDASLLCSQMCLDAGFKSGSATTQLTAFECHCPTGTGTVTAEACQQLCEAAGRTGGVPTTLGDPVSRANACRCDG